MYLCARYAAGSAINPKGPHLAVWPGENPAGYNIVFGNPVGAYAHFIQPMNEPNFHWWPQRSLSAPGSANDIGCIVAQMAQSADTAAAWVNGSRPFSPFLLIPGTADNPAGGAAGTPPAEFTRAVVHALGNWNPEMNYTGWAHHHYNDVKKGRLSDGSYRLDRVVDELAGGGWGDDGQGGIWLTEGGYHFPIVGGPGNWSVPNPEGESLVQQVRMKIHYRDMRLMGGRYPIELWAQYLIHDGEQEFQSSLRGEIEPRPGMTPPYRPNPNPYRVWADWLDGSPGSPFES